MTTQMQSTCWRKKLISWTLVLAFLVSLCPVLPVFVSANSPAVQTIDFCPEGGSGDPGVYALAEHGWQLDMETTSAAIPERADNWVIYPSSFWKAQMGMGEEIVLDFQLTQAGTYDVSVLGWQLDAMGIIGQFIIDGVSLGNFDFSHPDQSGTNQDATGQIGTMALSAGEHKLRIRRINVDTGGDLLFLSQIRFTPVEEASPFEQYINFCVPSGSKEPSAFDLNFDGWQVDTVNTTAPQNGGNYVVQIDPYGLKAVMNPKERIVLDFHVAVDGVYDIAIRGSQFHELGLTGEVIIDGVSIGTYPFTTPNGEAQIDGVELKVGSIALRGGTHKLAIRRTDTTSAGYMFLAGMRLTPTTLSEGTEQHISFLRLDSRDAPEDYPLSIYGWSLNQEETSPAIPARTANWDIHDTVGIKAEFASGEQLTFDFNVGTEGFYLPTIIGTKVENYGILAEIAIDGAVIGTYDFSDLETNMQLDNVRQDMEKIALSAGTHTLSITKVDENGKRGDILGGFAYMWLIGLDLTPTAPDPIADDMQFTFQAKNAQGEAEEHFNPGDIIYVQPILSGGESFRFGAVQADIVYDNTRLEVIDEETAAQEGFSINAHYAENTVRLAYGGAEISATSPYALGTIALRVKRGIASGETVLSYENAKVSQYNTTDWETSTAEGTILYLHNITVRFTAGSNGALDTVDFHAKYNTPGLYTADDYAVAAAEPVPAANEGWRVADAEERWMKTTDSTTTSFLTIQDTAFLQDEEYIAQYIAVWKVEFLPGEHGTIDSGATLLVDDGARLEAGQVPTPTAAAGYVFTGWVNGNGEPTDPAGQTIAADTTYTAQYAPELDITSELKIMGGVSGCLVLAVEPGKLPEGKVYQYNGTTTLLYSEAHNAYVCLVPESDTAAASKISLADGEVPVVKRGEINGDGAVDTLDAMLVYTYYNNVDGKLDALVAAQNMQTLFALDYNGDFEINILDVTAIVIAYLGL